MQNAAISCAPLGQRRNVIDAVYDELLLVQMDGTLRELNLMQF